ncbi:MAG TPA: HAMP domain-containing sensor histidine kinase, partial [Polyangia bacterium]
LEARRHAEAREAEYRRAAEQIAHDVLNPLSAARISVQAILRHSDGTDYQILARAERSLGRAEQIVNGIMDFARANAPLSDSLAPTDLSRVVEDVIEALVPQASAADEQLVVEHLDPVEVSCNEGLICSAVSNLLRNAINYTSDSEERRISIRVVDAGESGRFEVEDTGPGIAHELTDHIFDPYVRGAAHKKPGLGLGLATVRRVIEAHGGRVGVQSAVGHGSCFWFEVPKQPAGAVAQFQRSRR